MICGKCKDQHGSVAEVRKCYGQASPATATPEPTPAPAFKITDRRSQRNNLIPLGPAAPRPNALEIAQRIQHQEEQTRLARAGLPHQFTAHCPACVAHGVEHQESVPTVADYARQRSEERRPVPVAQTASNFSPDFRRPGHHDGLAPGGYALDSRTGNNDLDFWFLEEGDGKWAGWLFVRRVIGGRPNQKITKEEQNLALGALLALDPHSLEEAGLLFAEELEQCRRCNRHLTVEASRLRGYGPDCYGKL